jgi:ribose 5-phosphate isomerase B
MAAVTGRILIASDHAGFRQKEFLLARLREEGYEVQDLGCNSTESVHYPDFASEVARGIQQGAANTGVLICGSGEGMVMAANRFAGVRAGLAWNTEIAALLRQHNDAQIICFGARFTADAYAWTMLKTFLSSGFDGGNHAIRVEKMNQLS